MDKYTVDTFKQNVKQSWLDIFEPEFNKKYFKELLEKIASDIKKYPKLQCFPSSNLVMNAFTFFDVVDTKCVFLGMDPYIGFTEANNVQVPQAMGLSFSVNPSINYKKIPGSLKNIFKELLNDVPDIKQPTNGDLTRWAKEENILLLNSALTVMQKSSGVHLKYWEPFTDHIIKYISDNCNYVVFILLGNDAKKKMSLIDENKHGVITAGHPSPLNAKGNFIGSKIFSKTNKLLEENNKLKINWGMS